MPTIELRRSKRTKPESTYLSKFAANVTSQDGEDGVIAKILEIMGVANRWCVEFGAWDGKHLSNTWSLINTNGWSAVLAEGNAERAHHLAETYRARAEDVFVVPAFVGWEGENSLDAILSRTPIPNDFDVLSIDIDGNDWHVWNCLTRYRPRLIVVEFNPSASNNLYFVQDPIAGLNQGASLLSFIDLGKRKGYELVATTPVNAFFVTTEEFHKFGISDNSIDAMYEPLHTTEICQGFDGTIFAAGRMMLIWHGLQLTQEDFQVLPTALRRYQGP